MQILTDSWIWQLLSNPFFFLFFFIFYFFSFQLVSSFLAFACLELAPPHLSRTINPKEIRETVGPFRSSFCFIPTLILTDFTFHFNYSLVFWHGFFSPICLEHLTCNPFDSKKETLSVRFIGFLFHYYYNLFVQLYIYIRLTYIWR